MSQHVPRWVYASLADHFKTVADGIPLQFFVEGVDEDEIEDFQSDTALFRLNGPSPYTGSGVTVWRLEVQILLTDLVQSTQDNAYDIFVWAGIFAEDMETGIPIYKYGTGVDDDGTLLGCLEMDRTARNGIRIVNYGQVDKTARVRQVSVNGRFEICV